MLLRVLESGISRVDEIASRPRARCESKLIISRHAGCEHEHDGGGVHLHLVEVARRAGTVWTSNAGVQLLLEFQGVQVASTFDTSRARTVLFSKGH